MNDDTDDFIALCISQWHDEFHFQALWDKQPLDVRHIKHDMPDQDTINARRDIQQRIRRELEFIAYDCS
jgi:hypothetical protein